MITLGGVLTTTWIGNGPGAWVHAALRASDLRRRRAGLGDRHRLAHAPPFISTMATSIIVSSAALGSPTVRRAAPRRTCCCRPTRLQARHPGTRLFPGDLRRRRLDRAEPHRLRRYPALGTVRDAARIAGVPITLVAPPYVTISALVCAGFVGMMLVGYANGATSRMGDNYMPPSIAPSSSAARRPRRQRQLRRHLVSADPVHPPSAPSSPPLDRAGAKGTTTEGGIILVAPAARGTVRAASRTVRQTQVGGRTPGKSRSGFA